MEKSISVDGALCHDRETYASGWGVMTEKRNLYQWMGHDGWIEKPIPVDGA